MPPESVNGAPDGPPAVAAELLYHFGRLQLPAVPLTLPLVERHLERTFSLFRNKTQPPVIWPQYLEGMQATDWILMVGCLEGSPAAWELLFAARTGRPDCLLVDALRARAARLYAHDNERQESAVTEFWGHLLIPETPGAIPVLARYDGQRPLVPWLIRVFQNWHISLLRHHPTSSLADDAIAPLPANVKLDHDSRWHEAFRLAAHDSLQGLSDTELLILGLRLRYRMSQRDVARLLGVHEGTVSRQTASLRDRWLNEIARRLLEQGWTGNDLSEYVRLELGSLLLDEPRLAADHLAALLAARGKALPPDP